MLDTFCEITRMINLTQCILLAYFESQNFSCSAWRSEVKCTAHRGALPSELFLGRPQREHCWLLPEKQGPALPPQPGCFSAGKGIRKWLKQLPGNMERESEGAISTVIYSDCIAAFCIPPAVLPWKWITSDQRQTKITHCSPGGERGKS